MLRVDVLIQSHTFEHHLVGKRPLLMCRSSDRSPLTAKASAIPQWTAARWLRRPDAYHFGHDIATDRDIN
jgi:hypothetical protein